MHLYLTLLQFPFVLLEYLGNLTTLTLMVEEPVFNLCTSHNKIIEL